MSQNTLSNLQREILKIYSTDISEDELNELKNILAQNYAKKAVYEADMLWDEKSLSNADMEKWLNG
jgi:hypothetical protein